MKRSQPGSSGAPSTPSVTPVRWRVAAALACGLVAGASGCGVGYGYSIQNVNAPPTSSDNGIPEVNDRRVTTTMGVHSIDLHDESGILSSSVGTAANKYLAEEDKKRELRDTTAYREGKTVTGTYTYKRLAPVPGMRTKLSIQFGGSSSATVSNPAGMEDKLTGQELGMFGVRMQTALRTWVVSSMPALSIDLSQEAIVARYRASALQVPGISPGDQDWSADRFYWRFSLGTSYRLSPKLATSAGVSVDPIVGGLFALFNDGGDGIGYGVVADVHYTPKDWLVVYAHAQYDRGGTLAESTSSWAEVTVGVYYFWEPGFWKLAKSRKP